MGSQNSIYNTKTNYNLNKKISLKDLTKEEKEVISKIPKLNKIIICRCCGKIPLINVITSLNQIYFKIECKKNYSISELNGLMRSSFELIDPKIQQNKNEDLLPFESKEDFIKFKDVAVSYLNLKDKISELNYGDSKKNLAFTFFENLLSIGLYGNQTKYEYLNSIVIGGFTESKFFYYNKIYQLPNGGKKFILKKNIECSFNQCELIKFDTDCYAIKSSNYIKIINGSIESNIHGRREIDRFDGQGIKGIIREVIYICEDKYLIRDGSLILAEKKGKKYECETLLNKIEDIIHMRELKYRIKKFSKNENTFQFLLFSKEDIFLYEYSKESGCNLLKQSKYNNNQNNYNLKCNSFTLPNNNILITRDKSICLFNLNYFEIIATFEANTPFTNDFIRINDSKILCGEKTVIDIKNFHIDYLNFGPNQLTSVNIINNNYIYNIGNSLCCRDMDNKKEIYIPHHSINSDKIFSINQNEFCVFYSKYGNNHSTFLDIYSFLD